MCFWSLVGGFRVTKVVTFWLDFEVVGLRIGPYGARNSGDVVSDTTAILDFNFDLISVVDFDFDLISVVDLISIFDLIFWS